MRKVLVLGASIYTDRYSNRAIRKLVAKGFTTYGLGRSNGRVGPMTIFLDQQVIDNLYAISIYLNASNQASYYTYILDLKPEKVIFNPGAENLELEDILDQNGIYYERACTLVLLSLDQL